MFSSRAIYSECINRMNFSPLSNQQWSVDYRCSTLRVVMLGHFLVFWSGSNRACWLVIMPLSSVASSIMHLTLCPLVYLPALTARKADTHIKEILEMSNIIFSHLILSLLSLPYLKELFKKHKSIGIIRRVSHNHTQSPYCLL